MRDIGEMLLTAIPLTFQRAHGGFKAARHAIESFEQGLHLNVGGNLWSSRDARGEIPITDRTRRLRQESYWLCKSARGKCGKEDRCSECKKSDERDCAGDLCNASRPRRERLLQRHLNRREHFASAKEHNLRAALDWITPLTRSRLNARRVNGERGAFERGELLLRFIPRSKPQAHIGTGDDGGEPLQFRIL